LVTLFFHADQQQTDKQEESLSALALLFFAAFVLQREVFKHFDEDLCRREDKIIHNKLTSHEEKIFHNKATKVAKMDSLNF
jgi:hypothetical protein